MLWSIGRYDLHLSEEDFWRLVPRQYFALLDRHREQILRNEMGPAIVAWVISRIAGSKKTTPQQFMPSARSQPKDEVPWQALMAKVKGIHKSLGGTGV
jgi:hypothetical protein